MRTLSTAEHCSVPGITLYGITPHLPVIVQLLLLALLLLLLLPTLLDCCCYAFALRAIDRRKQPKTTSIQLLRLQICALFLLAAAVAAAAANNDGGAVSLCVPTIIRYS